MISELQQTAIQKVRRRRSQERTQIATGMVKTSISLSTEEHKRLGIYALMSGQDQQAVVRWLIREFLPREWVVQHRPARGPVESHDQLDSPMETVSAA